ncbi:hypothetical protein SAMN05421805_104100 [Saccharopolyspora antimicrobica]|uniref:Uncharacterized protein n=1 Tax=Saccharopolyspora antimicrobica TaxID=455193 RepID=A0A1I4YE41_9PSEU|nr:hypothetical protein [Saccharopolyspora antimicrobica]RKT82632.1 hypothetical protein ATL45_0885 [Saccharopolyspora antimicrobica]SFN36246.1 hypothetical protein SAMN05421805_104100 [Saccharopolyspora antimicrobica]
MAETIVRSGDDAKRRLLELGLRLDYIDEAIRAGVEARRPRNDFEPKSASGLKDWIARVGALREHVVSGARWCYADPHNVPLVYAPDKSRALGVLLGDENTGNEMVREGPRSKYPRGRVSAQAAAAEDQLAFFGVGGEGRRGRLEVSDLVAMDVWLLVTRLVEVRGAPEGGDQILVNREVSLAGPIEPGEQITFWQERLVFSPQRFEAPMVLPEGPEDPDEIDVYVRAR